MRPVVKRIDIGSPAMDNYSKVMLEQIPPFTYSCASVQIVRRQMEKSKREAA